MEICWSLFPAGAVCGSSQHRKQPTLHIKQVRISAKSEFWLSWLKLCSSGNHWTTALKGIFRVAVFIFFNIFCKIYFSVSLTRIQNSDSITIDMYMEGKLVLLKIDWNVFFLKLLLACISRTTFDINNYYSQTHEQGLAIFSNFLHHEIYWHTHSC